MLLTSGKSIIVLRNSKPEKKKKESITARINDTIWFPEIEEQKIPIDAKALQSKINPIYDPKIPATSTFPVGVDKI